MSETVLKIRLTELKAHANHKEETKPSDELKPDLKNLPEPTPHEQVSNQITKLDSHREKVYSIFNCYD